jgi:hypothetical protein
MTLEIKAEANKKYANENSTKRLVEEPLAKETAATKSVKPRALIFRAPNKEFCKIVELVKSDFPEVEVLYITTGSAKSILKVTKSIPPDANYDTAFFDTDSERP